ncbi:hypothetical protein [Methylophaga sp.]|uniref:hypothetical protein n=1 Tax=Methylophaga sp. TaxID=2024840 RepID=UPI003F69F9F3
MNDWLYLLLIPVLLLIIWFWPEQRDSNTSGRGNDETDDDNTRYRYHAVSVQACSHACDAAMRLNGKRFLANEVTPLPLVGCEASKCQCTYKHYADRRQDYDRRHVSVAMEHIYSKQEHRKGRDRRQQHVFQ